MNADRYARVTELFLTVRDLPPAERAAGLKRACAGDESLEREVTALLSQVTETSIFAGRSHVGLGPEANSKWSEVQRHYLYARGDGVRLFRCFLIAPNHHFRGVVQNAPCGGDWIARWGGRIYGGESLVAVST
jgi:hypothetical protein